MPNIPISQPLFLNNNLAKENIYLINTPVLSHSLLPFKQYQTLGYFRGHWADKAAIPSVSVQGDKESEPTADHSSAKEEVAHHAETGGVVKSNADSIAARMGLARLPTEAEMEDVWRAVEAKIHVAENARNLLQRAKDRAFR
jgi:hypothetical protein